MNDLQQYFTPFWVAEAIIDRYFPDLDETDMVLEPSCGKGSFLSAIPDDVPAIGVEIDPYLVGFAARETGRLVIHGDFRTVRVPVAPTAIIGNPPFNIEVVDGFLSRAHELLPDGGRVGFILPAYGLQTPSRVMRYREYWSIQQDMMPRTIFGRMEKPLNFVVFSKDRQRSLVGFFLYSEANDIQSITKQYRSLLERGVTRSVWARVVETALLTLGGEASLHDIYREIEDNRPTENNHWKPKVRQTLQQFFENTGPAKWALAEAVA